MNVFAFLKLTSFYGKIYIISVANLMLYSGKSLYYSKLSL